MLWMTALENHTQDDTPGPIHCSLPAMTVTVLSQQSAPPACGRCP